MKCPYCQTIVDDSLDTCPECGLDLAEYKADIDENVCVVCGARLNRWDKRCNTCLTKREDMHKYKGFAHLPREERIAMTWFDFVEEDGGVTIRELKQLYEHKIVVPSVVTKIGERAFGNREAMFREVILPEGLLEIGKEAFLHAAITEIVVPNSVTTLGEGAFAGNYFLKKAMIYGVREIGERAFSHCIHLREIGFGPDLESIGSDAFCFCHDLERITLPEPLQSIDSNAFAFCRGLRHAQIPATVTTVGDAVFMECKALELVDCGPLQKPDGWSEYWLGWDLSTTIEWGYEPSTK